MESSEVFAARELVFVGPDGSETISAVQFGRPYPNKDLSCYCCDFEIPGIEKRRYGAGVDGIQAIQMSMLMVAAHLERKAQDGWQYLWPDTRENITVREMFSADQFGKIGNDA